MPRSAFPDLGTRHLQAVLAVAEYRSFVAAAAHLGTSQPALSRTIKAVEATVGARLFERNTRHVRLTEAGREFAAVAERLCADLRIAVESLREIGVGQRGLVVLSSIMSVATSILPSMLATFRAAHPGMEVMLREGVHDAVLTEVRTGAADLGITYTDALPAPIAATPLARQGFAVLMPRDHALAGRPGLALGALDGTALVALPAEARSRRIVDAAALESGITLRPSVTVTQFATLVACVRAGLGAAIVPTGAVAGLCAPDLATILLVEPPLTLDLGLITLRDRALSPPAAALAALVRSQWPDAHRLMHNSA